MINDTNAIPLDEEVEETEIDDVSADLSAAWDASEGEDDGDQVVEAAVEPKPDQEAPDFPESDAVIGSQPDEKITQASDDDTDKAPAGLSPEAREAWKDTPKSVRSEIAKRENDYAAGIEKHRANTERVQGMDQALQPFQQLFAMNGGPGKTLPPLLQTASLLQMGSAPQKAQAVANLIKQFGVDIQTLDNYLVGGEAPAEVQQNSQLEQMFNQRLGPMQQQLDQYQQRDQQVASEQQNVVAQEVNAFGTSNEFYNDVRSDMADLLDMAANRGRQMSMDEAYKTACAAHPQISKILSARVDTKSVGKKRNAASSIRGTSGGSMVGAAPDSMNAALNDAWDNIGRM